MFKKVLFLLCFQFFIATRFFIAARFSISELFRFRFSYFFQKNCRLLFLIIFLAEAPFSDLSAASHRPNPKMEAVVLFFDESIN